MKRIDIEYGGTIYHVVDRDTAELRREIDAAVASGGGWLTVRDGTAADVFLHVASGAPIALMPIRDDEAVHRLE